MWAPQTKRVPPIPDDPRPANAGNVPIYAKQSVCGVESFISDLSRYIAEDNVLASKESVVDRCCRICEEVGFTQADVDSVAEMHRQWNNQCTNFPPSVYDHAFPYIGIPRDPTFEIAWIRHAVIALPDADTFCTDAALLHQKFHKQTWDQIFLSKMAGLFETRKNTGSAPDVKLVTSDSTDSGVTGMEKWESIAARVRASVLMEENILKMYEPVELDRETATKWLTPVETMERYMKYMTFGMKCHYVMSALFQQWCRVNQRVFQLNQQYVGDPSLPPFLFMCSVTDFLPGGSFERFVLEHARNKISYCSMHGTPITSNSATSTAVTAHTVETRWVHYYLQTLLYHRIALISRSEDPLCIDLHALLNHLHALFTPEATYMRHAREQLEIHSEQKHFHDLFDYVHGMLRTLQLPHMSRNTGAQSTTTTATIHLRELWNIHTSPRMVESRPDAAEFWMRSSTIGNFIWPQFLQHTCTVHQRNFLALFFNTMPNEVDFPDLLCSELVGMYIKTLLPWLSVSRNMDTCHPTSVFLGRELLPILLGSIFLFSTGLRPVGMDALYTRIQTMCDTVIRQSNHPMERQIVESITGAISVLTLMDKYCFEYPKSTQHIDDSPRVIDTRDFASVCLDALYFAQNRGDAPWRQFCTPWPMEKLRCAEFAWNNTYVNRHPDTAPFGTCESQFMFASNMQHEVEMDFNGVRTWSNPGVHADNMQMIARPHNMVTYGAAITRPMFLSHPHINPYDPLLSEWFDKRPSAAQREELIKFTPMLWIDDTETTDAAVDALATDVSTLDTNRNEAAAATASDDNDSINERKALVEVQERFTDTYEFLPCLTVNDRVVPVRPSNLSYGMVFDRNALSRPYQSACVGVTTAEHPNEIQFMYGKVDVDWGQTASIWSLYDLSNMSNFALNHLEGTGGDTHSRVSVTALWRVLVDGDSLDQVQRDVAATTQHRLRWRSAAVKWLEAIMVYEAYKDATILMPLESIDFAYWWMWNAYHTLHNAKLQEQNPYFMLSSERIILPITRMSALLTLAYMILTDEADIVAFWRCVCRSFMPEGHPTVLYKQAMDVLHALSKRYYKKALPKGSLSTMRKRRRERLWPQGNFYAIPVSRPVPVITYLMGFSYLETDQPQDTLYVRLCDDMTDKLNVFYIHFSPSDGQRNASAKTNVLKPIAVHLASSGKMVPLNTQDASRVNADFSDIFTLTYSTNIYAERVGILQLKKK